MGGPISIKEILAQLNGVFPMDEAVVEGIVIDNRTICSCMH